VIPAHSCAPIKVSFKLVDPGYFKKHVLLQALNRKSNRCYDILLELVGRASSPDFLVYPNELTIGPQPPRALGYESITIENSGFASTRVHAVFENPEHARHVQLQWVDGN
jgi:hypothetical protein